MTVAPMTPKISSGLAVPVLAVLALGAVGGARAQAVSQRGAGLGGSRAALAGVISTAAGGVGGPGKATQVALTPCGVSFADGHVYIGGGSTVRKVSELTDSLATPAGTGSTAPLGDGGPAARASLDGACGVAVDRSGNLLIADTNHDRVRVEAAASGTFYGRAMTAGHIYTVAGTGKLGFSGDGGPAAQAELNGPSGVAVAANGNLLIADSSNLRVRVVAASSGTYYGQAMTAGDIYTVAGDGTSGFSGDGGPATQAEFRSPSGMAVDSNGNLLITDTGNNALRIVAATTGMFYGQAMTAGDIYTVAGDGTGGFSGDGGPATQAQMFSPYGIAVDRNGNLLIADYGNNRVRVVAATTGMFYGQAMTAGDIYTVAGEGFGGFSGDGGPADKAKLNLPRGVAVDSNGNLLIADWYNNRVRVVVAASGTYYGKAMTAGHIYTVAGNGTLGFSGDRAPAIRAELYDPEGLAVDSRGNLLIADYGNSRVRIMAASSGTYYGQAMTAGDIYTVAGDGTQGFSGDGGPAVKADFAAPAAVAVDANGNLVIADTINQRVRVVAASSGTFYGQAMTAGDVYTIAGNGTGGFSGDGGPAASAEFKYPGGVGVDGNGNLLIADTDNNRVRVVAATSGTFYGQPMTAGDIYTVAGGGTRRPGNGGPATSARLNTPTGVTVDSAGNLLIADYGNNRVQVVAATSGTFYGQPMTAGDIYTVAGDGTGGFSGDGGPATLRYGGLPRRRAHFGPCRY